MQSGAEKRQHARQGLIRSRTAGEARVRHRSAPSRRNSVNAAWDIAIMYNFVTYSLHCAEAGLKKPLSLSLKYNAAWCMRAPGGGDPIDGRRR